MSARALSSAAAMRAFAAVVILTAFSLRSRAHAHTDVTSLPIQRLVKCARDIGPSKCLSALAAFRAENALTSIKNQKADFTLARDLKDFQWERYANKSEDQMYTQLCDGTEKLLRYRSMDFDMVPGYEIKFLSKGNGTLNFDVYHSESSDGARGMKKWRKQFYNIVPILLLPGLLMSAVLPFVLPALKMMTVAVGMLNNMALSGAIFTLLRNNAFNDKYDKKVIYINEGYHNEKQAKYHHKLRKPENVIDFGAHESQVHTVTELAGDDFEVVDDTPIGNEDWINDYYANKFVKLEREDYRRDWVNL